MSQEEEVLAALHLAGRRRVAGFLLFEHAVERMFERRIRRADIAKTLTETNTVVAQANDTWKAMGGSDLDDDPLVLIVAVSDGVVIVTLF